MPSFVVMIVRCSSWFLLRVGRCSLFCVWFLLLVLCWCVLCTGCCSFLVCSLLFVDCCLCFVVVVVGVVPSVARCGFLLCLFVFCF